MQFSGWRTISRAAAVGTLSGLAAGVLLATAPAHAAPADAEALIYSSPNPPLVVDTTYADFRVAVAHIAVNEPFQLTFDLSKLDSAVARRLPELASNCATSPTAKDTLVCDYTMQYAKPNLPVMFLPVPFKLERSPGGSGPAGSITATLKTSKTPVDETQQSRTFLVDVPAKDKVPTHGVDLAVKTRDVFEIDDNGYTANPVPPGDISVVFAAFANFGDAGAKGVKVSVKLPEHVTFAEAEPGCTYTADNRTVTCEYQDLVLAPLSTDPNPTDDKDGVISTAGTFFPVKVAADAPGPVVLTGGMLTATPMGVVAQPANPSARKAAAAPSQLPKGLKAVAADEFTDADLSDNTAEFKVHVGGVPAAGGGTPAAGGGTHAAGGGASLPVTGAQTAVIGGVGGAAVLLGAGLFVAARRRRVVLVIPTDEKLST